MTAFELNLYACLASQKRFVFVPSLSKLPRVCAKMVSAQTSCYFFATQLGSSSLLPSFASKPVSLPSLLFRLCSKFRVETASLASLLPSLLSASKFALQLLFRVFAFKFALRWETQFEQNYAACKLPFCLNGSCDVASGVL